MKEPFCNVYEMVFGEQLLFFLFLIKLPCIGLTCSGLKHILFLTFSGICNHSRDVKVNQMNTFFFKHSVVYQVST